MSKKKENERLESGADPNALQTDSETDNELIETDENQDNPKTIEDEKQSSPNISLDSQSIQMEENVESGLDLEEKSKETARKKTKLIIKQH